MTRWWTRFVRNLFPYSTLAEVEDSVTSHLRRLIPPTGSRLDLLARQERGETLTKPQPRPVLVKRKKASK